MKQRVAVITGASSGVGLEIATHLHYVGWKVIGLARSFPKTKLFDSYSLDVRNAKDVEGMFNWIWESQLKLDELSINLLVNNAAVYKRGTFSEMSISDIDDIIDTNLKGTLYCTRFALPMIKRPGGRIINIGSVAGEQGIVLEAAYCASKFGVFGMAEALAEELEGINVTTIAPGGIDTVLWNKDNPYLGDKTKLLHTCDIAKMVSTIASMPDNVVVKKVVLHPSDEKH